MIRLITLLLLLITVKTGTAQTISSDSLKILNDLFKDDDLLKLLDSSESPKSTVKISLGIGNKFFSVKNNSINTSQSQVNKIYYTPSVSYHHKSGLSLGLTPYITGDNGSLKIYQTAASTGYDIDNDYISTGISYTHYFADNSSYNDNSIYQHDIYGFIQYNKIYINPSLSLGYSAGNFKEINFYALSNTRTLKDSTNNSIQNFSISTGIEHSFTVDSIFSNKDAFLFTPQLTLQAGSEKYTTTHINKAYDVLLKGKRTNKIRSRTKTTNAKLALQSLALSLDATYSFGKYFLSPNIYSDYYLPETTDKKLTTVFSVAFGVTF
jgi:hypothetical protein